MNYIKNNWVICAFIVFILLEIVYINRSFIDVTFLDGLMPLPMIEKYFQGNLSLTDINMSWGQHRLIGYSLIYLANTVFFGLNIKLEPYIFLLSYFSIGLVLYFVYKKFLKTFFKNSFRWWMELSYLPILFLIFSLVHAPGMYMTTQFVVGTLFFVLVIKFFDLICLDSKKWLDLIWFLILISIYFVFFSGANFGGMILGFVICSSLKILISNKKKPSFFWLISILFTIFLTVGYLSLNRVDQDGVGLIGKIVIFLSRFSESFLAILAGISGTTLDIHTFQEKLGGRDIFVLINGGVLFLLGLYSIFKYVFLKIYKFTYIPLLLISYSIGFMMIARLGRLDGGWMWPMNDWYSFHLYFYLVGVLWILFYDILIKYVRLSRKSFKFLFIRNKWTVIIFIFSIFWIFSFQTLSNLAMWQRGPYVQQWLEVKRLALLYPTDESLEFLLWPKDDSLKAIEILKNHKLSVFREDAHPGKIIKLSGWNSDSWIEKSAKARITSGKEGNLSMNVYLPVEIFSKVYNNSLLLQVIVDGKIIEERKFSSGIFDKGPIDIVLDIPKNKTLNLELKLDKSYIPAESNLGKDSRELGILINKFDVK